MGKSGPLWETPGASLCAARFLWQRPFTLSRWIKERLLSFQVNNVDRVKQKVLKTDGRDNDRENGESEEKYPVDDDDDEAVPDGDEYDDEDEEDENDDDAAEDEEEEEDDA